MFNAAKTIPLVTAVCERCTFIPIITNITGIIKPIPNPVNEVAIYMKNIVLP